MAAGGIAAQASAEASVPWTAHPEVWFLVLGALAIGWYASRVLQPKAIAAGLPAITAGQKRWFAVGILGIWIASDWPVHDVAEDHLYSVHMVQHLALSLLIPAAFVLATPRWVFELLVRPGSSLSSAIRKLSKPVVAGLIFNALTMWLHWSRVVQWSADSGAVHFGFHLLVFASGLLMWMPIIGPVKEWRLSPLGQCIYLFAMSIVPTVPGGWLVFATGVVYRHYDTPARLWGVDVLTDQQAAGAIMKLGGGFLIWGIIVVIFGRWAAVEQAEDRQARLDRHKPTTDLTFEAVNDVFVTTSAPVEPPS